MTDDTGPDQWRKVKGLRGYNQVSATERKSISTPNNDSLNDWDKTLINSVGTLQRQYGKNIHQKTDVREKQTGATSTTSNLQHWSQLRRNIGMGSMWVWQQIHQLQHVYWDSRRQWQSMEREREKRKGELWWQMKWCKLCVRWGTKIMSWQKTWIDKTEQGPFSSFRDEVAHQFFIFFVFVIKDASQSVFIAPWRLAAV